MGVGYAAKATPAVWKLHGIIAAIVGSKAAVSRFQAGEDGGLCVWYVPRHRDRHLDIVPPILFGNIVCRCTSGRYVHPQA